MSLTFFEGPAGSGKTRGLFETLSSTLTSHPLLGHEQVLALTKMHGSRRRMQGRLEVVPGLRGRFTCTTIDSFAWRTVRRWRALARATGWTDSDETHYEEVCTRAGALLADKHVARWITRRYPIVLVDEMQDSIGGQLAIIRALSQSAVCLVAADDFQDLDAVGENAAVAWARSNGTLIKLSKNHRTSSAGLLAAAAALREGRTLPDKGTGFRVLGAPHVNVGAGFVSRNLAWWQASNDIAIISPVSSQASRFVRDLILRVQQGPIGSPPTGPHDVRWEASQEQECQQFLAGLGLPVDKTVDVGASDLVLSSANSGSRALQSWFDQQRKVGGKTRFSAAQIEEQAKALHHRARAHRRSRDNGIRVMTIHQAKNREFDSVIVLWPYEVVGSHERRRRLLYNAITRARQQAVVVVQNPQRLKQPPFALAE